MEWIAAAILLLSLYIWGRRRAARRRTEAFLNEPWRGRQFLAADDPEDRPDNPRFPTWEAAFNRAVTDDLRFRIEYSDRDGTIEARDITPKSIHLVRGEAWLYIRAYCHLREEERTFRSDRILAARNLVTNRPITDLGQYLRGKY